jgi:hypothetical protein
VDANLELDTSWVNLQEKLENIDLKLSKEPMKSLTMSFIYINTDKSIEKIISEKWLLNMSRQTSENIDSGSLITKEELLKIIQSKKIKKPFSKYKFEDLLLYNITLESEHIQSYINMNSSLSIDNESIQLYMKPVSILEDVRIKDSIFIFHGINSLYFIFQEVSNKIGVSSHRNTLKSILKKMHSANLDEHLSSIQDKNITKKVNIRETNNTTKRKKLS